MPDTPEQARRPANAPDLTLGDVWRTWWPLAASWILMGLELPAVSAIMARLADPKISLAAYGGVVFPLSMIVEAPIIMLLSASTALCKDRQSYRLMRRFMLITGAALTAIHLLVVFTPLYGLVIGKLIRAPEEIRHPARIGLMIMTPWTWAIAYRRLQQGVLIRFGRSHLVGIGTAVRLGTNVLVLTIGYVIGTLPGIIVGATAVASGVVAEAIFAGFNVRPVLNGPVRAAPPQETPLTMGKFLHFYIPLAMTSLIALLVAPIGSAAVSRMPRALDSLAVWPVINGLTFMLRSVGIAYNEVVVALLGLKGAVRALRRFALLLGTATSSILILVAATPVAGLYFGRISALAPALAVLATHGIWFSVLMPGLGVIQSWHQGILVHSHRTRAITQAVVVYLVTSAVLLGIGIRSVHAPGLFVALSAAVIANSAQIFLLSLRSRDAIRELERPPGTARA
jgi:hypothetical protein